jgi:outer membrane protein TolC
MQRRYQAPRTWVESQEPARIADYVVGGHIELSLRDYVELVLHNNTDVALTRLQIHLLENGVQRSLGVFDPSFQASFSPSRSTEQTTTWLQGVPNLISLTVPFSLSYQQLLPSGVTMNVSAGGQRYSSNDAYSTFDPALSSNLSVQFTEPLLRNRGGLSTRLAILIARSNLRAGGWTFRDQVTNLLANAESAYWDAVQARENLAIQKKFLELRRAALDLARKQVAAGALLPLEVYQPSANYASAELAGIQAKLALLKSENLIRQQIGADLDPKFNSLPIVLTEPYADAAAALPDRESAVRQALDARLDRAALLEKLHADDLGITGAADALRPSLSLTGSYTSQGLAGVFSQFGSPLASLPGGSAITQVQGGFGQALSQMFRFGFPVYSGGITLSLPLGNRAAGADLSNAYLAKRQDALQLRKINQGIRLQVLNAIDDLETVQAAVKEASAARDFAGKRFAAEQKKYELGVTQLFFVLDAQTQLNAAEGDLLSESIASRRSLMTLHLALGDLLDERGVVLE